MLAGMVKHTESNAASGLLWDEPLQTPAIDGRLLDIFHDDLLLFQANPDYYPSSLRTPLPVDYFMRQRQPMMPETWGVFAGRKYQLDIQPAYVTIYRSHDFRADHFDMPSGLPFSYRVLGMRTNLFTPGAFCTRMLLGQYGIDVVAQLLLSHVPPSRIRRAMRPTTFHEETELMMRTKKWASAPQNQPRNARW